MKPAYSVIEPASNNNLINMKKFTLLLFAFTLLAAAHAQDKMLLETKYYRFYSNELLNVHLLLYQHATQIKSTKVPDDSLSIYLSKARLGGNAKMIDALKYYRDSVTKKDMLFDSTMRKFSVLLATGKPKDAIGWQVEAMKHINAIFPFYKKQVWPSIDSANKAWAQQVKSDLSKHEEFVIARLQKIYDDTMPAEKIRVDLGVYGTWAGAYSYSQGIDHIIISSFENANQGPLGVEIVFHEGSHFLMDRVYNTAQEYFNSKNLRNDRRQPWHIVLFYTTGNVVKEAYGSRGISFVPYYKHAKFEERIPPFKVATDALALYWDPYMRGEGTQQEALKKVMDHILSH
jgi:hypothetical protein